MGVLQMAVKKLDDFQLDFLNEEMGIDREMLMNALEEELDDIYDRLCDIECEETPNEGEISKRGRIAADIVTLWGDAIAEAGGYLDEDWED